jgi:site-specific recombinase XerD
VAAYGSYLQQRGYRVVSMTAYVHAVEHFIRWLAGEGIKLCESEKAVARFLADHLPGCSCPGPVQRHKVTMRSALAHLLRFMRAGGLIQAEESRWPSEIDNELTTFTNHLRHVCGLADNTVISRRQWVGRFLTHQFPHGGINVAALGPNDIHGFVKACCVGCQPGTAGVVCVCLRSYLRFRSLQNGDTVDRLLAAVPTIAKWPLASLPKHLLSEEADRWLNAFDRNDNQGKRDYAMARCLADLGLRCCEVAALRLDDIQWTAGTISIGAGKSRRSDVLPLPAATGHAIADYLQTGRPQSKSRQLFVPHRAPFGEAVCPGLVRGAMRRAADRCGLAGRFSGPHMLRHTIATRLIATGSNRKQIADLLRHRSLDTTAIYAKVDLVRLVRLAQPWPGGVL